MSEQRKLKMGRGKSSLALRLATWFLLLSCLPLAVIVVVVRRHVADAFTELATSAQRDQAKMLAAHLSLHASEALTFLPAMAADRPGYCAFVLDQNGIYLAHTDASRVGGSAVDDLTPDTVARLLAGGDGELIEPETGSIIGYADVPAQGIMAVVVTDKTWVTEPLSAIERSSLIQLAVSLIISAAAGGVVIWFMVGRPLRQLARAAEQIGQDSLDIAIQPDEMEGELATLAGALNQMAGQLRDLVVGLEQRVMERKQAEESLAQERTLLRTLVDALPNPVYAKDLAGRKILSNRADQRVMGAQTEAEVLGKTDADVYAPELAATTSVQDQIVLSGKELIDDEDSFIDANGRRRWMLTSKSPLRNQDGQIIGLVGVTRNISDRKRAEHLRAALYRISEAAHQAQNLDELYRFIHTIVSELMPARNFYIALYDAAQDLIRFVYHIDEFDATPLPYKPNKGMTAYVLRTGEPLLATSEIFARLERSGQVERTGNPALDWLGVPLKTTTQKTIGVMVVQTYTATARYTQADLEVLTFISTQAAMALERKQAEESLAQERNLLRTLIDTLPDAVYAKDLAGRKILSNRADQHAMGAQTEADALGKTDFDVYDPEVAARTRIQDQAVLVGGQVVDEEDPFVTADGRRLWLFKRPLRDQDGQIVGMVGVTRDITEQKRAELERARLQAQLFQAQKMEVVGRLAGGIAHDFNNYLTAINGYAELLRIEFSEGDPRRADLEQICKAAEQSATLTRQLLAFSRKQIIEPTVLDLGAVVADMDKMLQRLIGEHIELSIVLHPDAGHVRADRGQIEQVIMNLVVNARDAVEQRSSFHIGRIVIEVSNVVLDEKYASRHLETEPGPYVLLAVSDNGIGMDEETQSHLFEPFFTTKDRRSDGSLGTGLGLATVFGVVKQNGGNIWVYSEPGQGTTFKVYLPRLAENIDVIQTERSSSPANLGSERVLLVEDNLSVRVLARRILEQQGYRVLEADNADAAVEVAAGCADKIDLLLTDMVMPGAMSGRDLAQRLVIARPEIKVLYMSGYTENAIVHQGAHDANGPNGLDAHLLQKPFTANVLARKVREVLDQPGK